METYKIFNNLLTVLIILTYNNNNVIFASEVTCSLEDYILTGIEFRQCQSKILDTFETARGGNPCKLIKSIVDSCSTIVKRCFSPRGWERGQVVFIDLLALQHPDQNECDVFEQKNNTGIANKLPDEKCSILEEVALLTHMTQCNTQAQSELAMKLQHHPKSTSPEKLLFSTANQALCDGLKNISEICYTKLLNQCYDAHDAYFHYMHMIEELKTAGILLAMHLLPIHANSNNVDILKCQVFQENSPFQNNSQVVVALAVVVSFLLLGFVITLVTFITFKLRLIPRIRAWMQNEPYEDVTNDTVGTVNEMTDVVQNSNHTRNEFENAAHNIGDNEQDFKSGVGGRAVNEVFANLRDQNEGSVPST